MTEGMVAPEQDNRENLFMPDEVVASPSAVSAEPASTTSTDPPVPSQSATPAVTAEPDAQPANPDAITWTASEFIAHDKSASWYSLLVLGGLGIGSIVYLTTRDPLATVAVIGGVTLLAVYARRGPREEQYMLDRAGLTIGNRHYGFHEFRSFAVVPEGAFMSIELTPLKRFAMYTNIYCDPADEDRIIDRLSEFLPMEAARNSLTDSVMRRIHF